MNIKRYRKDIWNQIDTDDTYCSPVEIQWEQFLRCCRTNYSKVRQYYKDKNGNNRYRYIFIIHNVSGRSGDTLNLEVVTEETAEHLTKIIYPSDRREFLPPTLSPTLFVANIPDGETIDDIIEDISNRAYTPVATDFTDKNKAFYFYEFNFETIDGDHFGAIPGINKSGKFELFGDDLSYLQYMDRKATMNAYYAARNVGIIELNRIK